MSLTRRSAAAPRWCAMAVALAVAVLVPVAAACDAVAATPAQTPPAPTGPPATPSAAAPSADPGPTPPAPAPVSVPGVIRAGAGPGCFLLSADDGRHFVLADAQNPPVAVPVTVNGVADPTEFSRCNGGTVLHVQSIARR